MYSTAHICTPTAFSGQVAWADRLELYKGGRRVDSQSLKKSKIPRAFKLADHNLRQELGNSNYTILGFADGKQVIKTHRFIRTIPSFEDYFTVEKNESFDWDFEFSKGAVLFNDGSEAEKGWVVEDDGLKIAQINNGNYSAMVDTAVSFFLNLPAKTSTNLRIQGSYDTEVDCDILFVTLDVGKNKTELIKFSGNGTIDEVIQLPRFSQPTRAELSFRFISDPLVEGPGVTIEQIRIEAN